MRASSVAHSAYYYGRSLHEQGYGWTTQNYSPFGTAASGRHLLLFANCIKAITAVGVSPSIRLTVPWDKDVRLFPVT